MIPLSPLVFITDGMFCFRGPVSDFPLSLSLGAGTILPLLRRGRLNEQPRQLSPSGSSLASSTSCTSLAVEGGAPRALQDC
ncbi:hypothetical protein M407DRAFT_124668 [Tulasnella calospora MUT 4182]|uniref:Uncharacterized protein n=1 Tax=Tulasnella calospora MUT 4182 TaxID=1051891 RepID=A0A0C3QTZ6_9AGAM|nr:hypothetical protein M407DRAFT_124668 [Tulasnella calospora MUT 4182]